MSIGLRQWRGFDQWVLTLCKACLDTLLRMLQTTANAHSFENVISAPLWEAPDPLPVMRREMKLLLNEMNVLRIEVEQRRAVDQEAHKSNELLIAYLKRIMESRDEWRREAEQRVDGASAAMVTFLVALC